MIDGWDVIGAQMHVGDRWKCTIPWQLAYGAGGAGNAIGPNATLLFDVELVAIAPKADEQPAPEAAAD